MKTFLQEHIERPALSGSIASLVLGLLGTVLASIIIIEKIALAENPNHITSCSFNPIVSCSPVMQSEQATAFFGIPNPIFGLIGFAVIAALSFFSIFVKLPRFIWVINSIGMALALTFCFWLATQALYSIGALCLYCCGVWVVTSILFWLSLRRVVVGTKFETISDYSILGTTVTILIFAVMVFFAFQRFWLSLMGIL